MIEIIKAGFSQGEIKTFNIQGEYLEILECAYPITVVMLDRNGVQLSVMRKAEASYFSRPGKYEVIQITSPEAQTIRVFVGSGDAGTRKTSGIVTIVDEYKNKADAGNIFMGAVNSPPSVNVKPYTQLWNPPLSNKKFFINKINISWDGEINKSVNIYFENNEFSNPEFGFESGANKKSGKAIGLAKLRVKKLDGAPTYPFGVMWAAFLESNKIFEWKSEAGPIVVMPGYGLSVFGNGFNAGLLTAFEWSEEDI